MCTKFRKIPITMFMVLLLLITTWVLDMDAMSYGSLSKNVT